MPEPRRHDLSAQILGEALAGGWGPASTAEDFSRFARFPPYSIAKYTMSLFALALAAEFAERGIAVNSLWPRTVIATAAVLYEIGGEEMMSGARKPEIVADAAHAILTLPARQWTGRFFLDDEVLLGVGVRDFSKYDAKPGTPLIVDFFTEALPGMKVFG